MEGEGEDALSSLDTVLAQAWSLLVRAAGHSDSGMSYPVLATRGLDDLPNARTVLLWRTDAARRTLYFHTDMRSPKCAELQRTPWALLVFYDRAAETQLRLHAHIGLHCDDELTRAAWEDLPVATRQVFATAQPPGYAANGPVTGPAAAALQRDGEADRAAYRNFVLLEAKVAHLDWLHVARAGHRRAAFTWTASDQPSRTWLYP